MDTPPAKQTVTLADGSPCTFMEGAWAAAGQMLAAREAAQLAAEQDAEADRQDAARADAAYERRQAQREYLDEF